MQPGGGAVGCQPGGGPVIRLCTLQASVEPFCTGHTWPVACGQVPVISALPSLPRTLSQKAGHGSWWSL